MIRTEFEGCKQLEYIALPYELTLIKQGAFKGYSALKEIKLPHKVNVIDQGVFENCTALDLLQNYRFSKIAF